MIEEYDVNIHVKSEKQSKTAAEYLDDFVTVNEPLSPVEEQDVIKAKAHPGNNQINFQSNEQ